MPVARRLRARHSSESDDPTRATSDEWLGTSDDYSSFSEQEDEELPSSSAQNQDEELPSDTLAALHLLRAQFPRLQNDLRLRNMIRLFKLSTSNDDYAAVLNEDYVEQVRRAKEAAKAKDSKGHIEVFDWFLQRLLPECVDVSINYGDLVRRQCPMCIRLLSRGGDAVKEDHVTLLINHGLLMQPSVYRSLRLVYRYHVVSVYIVQVRQLADTGSFWFAIPSVGPVLKSILKGRQELTGMLARRRYREMLQTDIEKKKLRYSVLGARFHMRDMMGSGVLLATPTTVGPLMRLARP
eukprot:jgi/Chlat1/9260/Chrsp99S08487